MAARRYSGSRTRYAGRIPARITSSVSRDGWVIVSIERGGRARRFRIGTDEIPALLAELGKYVHPVTITRRQDRPGGDQE
jgi:hypothetical protein